MVAEGAGVRRPRLSRRRRLHGSGQLGHRSRRRRALRLHAALRHPGLQPAGGPPPGARRSSSASRPAATSRRRAATTTRARSRRALWVFAEIAIAACDLAEVIGSAIALKLLFHIPLAIGVLITALRRARRALSSSSAASARLEVVVITLIATIALAFLFELVVSHPDLAGRRARLHSDAGRSSPTTRCSTSRSASSAPRSCRTTSICTRPSSRRAATRRPPTGKREAVRYAVLDSTVALTLALFINAAILIVAAATFHVSGHIGRRGDPGRLQAADADARRRGRQRACSRSPCSRPGRTPR